MSSPFTFADLQRAVEGGAVAIRARAGLQPAGGPGDKVFPPTYATGERAETRYAFETRIIDGAEVPTVLLDSVQSQANRMEEGLRAVWESGSADFPVITVDFSGEGDIADIGTLTSLDAPHRIADALLRDAVDAQGVPFRNTAIGKAYTDARVTHATAVFTACPTALVFGVWDSTGPKGGLGAKFPRALVSEIIGLHAHAGVKTASRIDPLGIQAVPVFHDKADPNDWTADEGQAAMDGKKPKAFSRSGEAGDKGKASAVNHSNIAPSIDPKAGGVTISEAVQTSVLSLVALRRLRFSTDAAGQPFSPDRRGPAERAARTALAALALVAITVQREFGNDLRSRCLLVPVGPLEFELLGRDGGEPRRFQLSSEEAVELLKAAAKAAAAAGLPWQREPLRLKPAAKLSTLIRKSRASAAVDAPEAR
jgi:CRISPR-associated protein Csb1